MILDEKGRIFGKINIIDASILLVLIAAAIFIGSKVIGGESIINTPQTEYEIKFYIDDMPDYLIDSMKTGGVVTDEAKTISLGTMDDIVLGPSIVYMGTDDGRVVASSRPGGFHSVTIISTVKATAFENGILIEGNKYSVGGYLTIMVGTGKCYMRISEINVKE